MMQYIGRHYVRYFNFTYKRTDTLWEGRFKSCLVDSESYALACYRYIEMNPVVARIVASPTDYKWTSYHANAKGVESSLISYHLVCKALAQSRVERMRVYQAIFKEPRYASLSAEIANAMKSGLVLGGEKFKSELEALTGIDLTPKRHGPVLS